MLFGKAMMAKAIEKCKFYAVNIREKVTTQGFDGKLKEQYLTVAFCLEMVAAILTEVAEE